ncbi:N-acyl-D-glutamate deacylase [Micromonospora sp. HB375]|uniref:N-acyl-D-amino-acid deacylase family protein n=1 Tax=unclassified Micromonospora TaxID=2617518 RepID=UPI001AEBA52E|nr:MULTISPECIES: D-aminoacylase [unclassified Micromonospora]MBP1782058.1 N-acyl-D-glutamate deacylase [Micromonospora sp. HB375]MDH6470867.1 N-acyl-D-glutamate deacylase [Micromonospora sp. H404/HB375]
MSTPDSLFISNVGVVDGLGTPVRRRNVLVVDGRIAAVTDPDDAPSSSPATGGVGPHVIDGHGRILSPGFIDVHTHDDAAVLMDPTMLCKTSQGVTTVVLGNCGIGIAPHSPALGRHLAGEFAAVLGYVIAKQPAGYGEYLRLLRESPSALNRAGLVPHGALRLAAMGDATRAADDAEIDAMCELLTAALEAGAVGMSTGLVYHPGRYAQTRELERLCAVLAARGAIYASHIRDEGARVLESISEVLALGRSTGCQVHVSHLKTTGLDGIGRMRRALDDIHAAAEAGVPVTFDVYPYTSGSTALEPALRAATSSATDPRAVRVISAPELPELEGRYLADLAEEWGTTQEQAVTRIAERDGSVTAVIEMMSPDTVAAALASPLAMIGSDGLPNPRGRTHPRMFGTFPRVLGRYVRPGGPLDLVEAIRRMTSLPAQRFGLRDRGAIQGGRCADLVLFNPAAVRDRATHDEPDLLADGIEMVIVNGAVTVNRQTPSAALAGDVLVRRP